MYHMYHMSVNIFHTVSHAGPTLMGLHLFQQICCKSWSLTTETRQCEYMLQYFWAAFYTASWWIHPAFEDALKGCETIAITYTTKLMKVTLPSINRHIFF